MEIHRVLFNWISISSFQSDWDCYNFDLYLSIHKTFFIMFNAFSRQTNELIFLILFNNYHSNSFENRFIYSWILLDLKKINCLWWRKIS